MAYMICLIMLIIELLRMDQNIMSRLIEDDEREDCSGVSVRIVVDF